MDFNSHPFSKKSLSTGTMLVIAGVVIIALASVIFSVWRTPPKLVRFSMILDGSSHWFELSGTTLSFTTGPSELGGSANIISIAPKLASSDIPALAAPDGAHGTVLGVIRKGVFIPELSDGTVKADLSDNADGLTVYDMPTQKGMTLASFQVNAGKKKATKLGEGFSPVLSKSRALLAFSSKGLARIDPTYESDGVAGRSTLFTRSGLTYGAAALSADASLAVMPNAVTGKVDVFSIDTLYSSATNYLGSIAGTPDAIAFVTPTEFVMHGQSGFTLYEVKNSSVTKIANLSLQK